MTLNCSFLMILHVVVILCIVMKIEAIPQGVSSYEYCAACQHIAKNIDRHIKIETGFNLEIQVALTLNEICEARMYKDSTNNAELVEQICHYMTAHHGDDMERVLLKYYKRKQANNQDASHIHTAETICSQIGACRDIQKMKPGPDDHKHGMVYVDEETEEIKIIHGPKVKVAGGGGGVRSTDPLATLPTIVKTSHDEL